MEREETYSIQTSDLAIGSTLTFDLRDGNGVVLHKAGTPISQRLLDRLRQSNVQTVIVKGSQPKKLDATGLLLSFHDAEFVKATERIVSQSEQALTKFSEQLRRGEKGDTREIRTSVDQFLTQSLANASATLAVVASRASQTPPELTAKLAARSSLLALLGVTISVMLKQNSRDSLHIGMSGLLHDCSLMLHPEWFSPDVGIAKSVRALSEYRYHPIESLELLSQAEGLSEDVRDTIVQVHEQFDGSGFPNGLSGNAINNAARILNVADAYLELVRPLFHDECIIPSDALAYLCHNAASNKFDSQCLKGMIMAMSLYPIGSLVELNDGILAVVVCCNAGNPMEPIVKLLTGENNTVNLAESPRYISQPHADPQSSAKRIDKTHMDQVLWRSDLTREAIL